MAIFPNGRPQNSKPMKTKQDTKEQSTHRHIIVKLLKAKLRKQPKKGKGFLLNEQDRQLTSQQNDEIMKNGLKVL